MKQRLDNDRPLFLQVKEAIEEDILSGLLKPGEQIPSNSQLVAFFGINPVTVHKGVSLLLDDDIIFKKRGLGMFVSDQAPAIIRRRYQKSFRQDYVQPLTQRAATLGLAAQELHGLIDESLAEQAQGQTASSQSQSRSQTQAQHQSSTQHQPQSQHQTQPPPKPDASLSDSILKSTNANLRGDGNDY